MPITKVQLSSIKQLFRPEQVAQVVVETDARGTPVLDEFYPENTREPFDQVLVPVERITSVTDAVPMVVRGAPGIPIQGESNSIDYIEAQPVRTYEALNATQFNNAREVSQQTLQDFADRQTGRHLETHRKTANSLAADSLDGQISFPLFNETGSKVDDYEIDFGASDIKGYAVQADWTAEITKLSSIHSDLREMRRLMRRDGKQVTDVLLGPDAFDAVLEKAKAVGNDTRIPARLTDDGTIRLGGFDLREFAAEFQDAETGSYEQVLSDAQLLMYDGNADWTLLYPRLDNFKMLEAFGADSLRQTPLGVVAEFSESGDSINIYANSKPFPIPPVRSILSTDVSAP